MGLLNVNSCDAAVGNTAVNDCAWTPKNIKGGFLAPPNFELLAADFATEAALQTRLQAALLAPVGQRIYPLPPAEAITDNSADPTIATLGYGGSFPVRDGDNDWTVQYVQGGVCLNNQLIKFNGGNYKYLAIDDANTLIGTRNATGDGMKGIPLRYFYAFPWKVNDGSNPTNLRFRIVYEPKYINQFVAYAKLKTFVLGDLRGLQNVNVTVVSRAAGVLQVTAAIGCGGLDAHNLFATQLADATLWTAKNANTKAPITITAVTSTATGWQLTLDITDVDYVANTPVEVNLAAPTVLDGKGVSGFEGVYALSA